MLIKTSGNGKFDRYYRRPYIRFMAFYKRCLKTDLYQLKYCKCIDGHRYYPNRIRPLFKKILSSNIGNLLVISIIMTLLTPMASFGENNLKMTITSTKVVSNGLNKTYVPVKEAEIGTVVQYKANFFNTSYEPLYDTYIILPLPTNTLFTGEAFPQSVQASTDYRNYQDLPIKKIQNGSLVTVPLSEYKSLRWNIKYLPPRKSVTVTFNTIVK